MAGVDVSKYAHSPGHKAILARDYASLWLILAALPPLCSPTEIYSEADSLAEEAKADAISTVIDCRDVPNRETPLQLAVKLGDATATEMLMGAGANWSLQNEQGWSALREAICAGGRRNCQDNSQALPASGLVVQEVALPDRGIKKNEGFLHGDYFPF